MCQAYLFVGSLLEVLCPQLVEMAAFVIQISPSGYASESRLSEYNPLIPVTGFGVFIGAAHGPRLIHVSAIAPKSFRYVDNPEFGQPEIERKKPIFGGCLFNNN